MKIRRALALGAITATAIGLSACSNDKTTTAASSDGTKVIEIIMTDNAYSPSTIQVAKGQRVTFKFLNQGKLDKAITYLERALQVNPNLAGASVTIQLLRQQLQERKDKTI